MTQPHTPGLVLTNVTAIDGNPYLALWMNAMREAGFEVDELRIGTLRRGTRTPQWVHLQWPERAVRYARRRDALKATVRLIAFTTVARARGARVLLTMHNVWSHDRRFPRLEWLLWRGLALLTTDLHLLSAAGAPEVYAAHPRLRRRATHVIPHGHYGPVIADVTDRASARSSLGFGPEHRVVATFGLLKPYKGTEELVAAFGGNRDPSARLVIAGRATTDELEEQLRQAVERDNRIVRLAGFVPDAQLATLIVAADLIALPYRQVLNSGSAMLALTLGRPVLMPSTPTFVDLAARTGGTFVTLYEQALGTDDISSALARARDSGAPFAPDLSWAEWAPIVETIRENLDRGSGRARGSG